MPYLPFQLSVEKHENLFHALYEKKSLFIVLNDQLLIPAFFFW